MDSQEELNFLIGKEILNCKQLDDWKERWLTDKKSFLGWASYQGWGQIVEFLVSQRGIDLRQTVSPSFEQASHLNSRM